KWKDGFILYFDNKNQKWKRQGEMEVVLKGLHNSKNITEEFLDEIKLQMRSHYELGNTIECFGITKDPETGDFMMIMEFMKDGSLRNYLSKNFLSLTWTQKLEILCTAAKGLRDIHEAKLIHKDLHPGNIHDSNLALEIARGRRPEINRNLTPQLVIDLIERCWKKDPNERPSANELHDCLWGWYSHSKSKSFHKIKGQIEEIEKSQSFERYLNNLPCNNNSTLLDSHESNTKSNMKSYTSSLIDISRIVKSVGVSDTGIVDLVIPEEIDNA
ncbi:16142_t:CDS:2, partial [Acaulospora morrowiae]